MLCGDVLLYLSITSIPTNSVIDVTLFGHRRLSSSQRSSRHGPMHQREFAIGSRVGGVAAAAATAMVLMEVGVVVLSISAVKALTTRVLLLTQTFGCRAPRSAKAASESTSLAITAHYAVDQLVARKRLVTLSHVVMTAKHLADQRRQWPMQPTWSTEERTAFAQCWSTHRARGLMTRRGHTCDGTATSCS